MKKIIILVYFMSFLSSQICLANSYLNETEQQELKQKEIWNEACPVNISRLVNLQIKYIDFNGVEHDDGVLMVLDSVAHRVQYIFDKLYEQKFPIERMQLINKYNGDDDLSVEDNNSSAFNCRSITNGKLFSIHSYGVAIDVNPQQNPYIIYNDNGSIKSVIPFGAIDYMVREQVRVGMLEPVIDLFKQNGFTIWGGDWNNPKDYHHFQTTRPVAEILTIFDTDNSKRFFELTIKAPKLVDLINNEKVKNILINKKDYTKLMDLLESLDYNKISVNEFLNLI